MATEFLVSAANYSERKALLKRVKSGITDLADRGIIRITSKTNNHL